MSKSYDLIFTHEEASWFGAVLAKIKKNPASLRHAFQPPPAIGKFSFFAIENAKENLCSIGAIRPQEFAKHYRHLFGSAT
jgi:hypothetical protein